MTLHQEEVEILELCLEIWPKAARVGQLTSAANFSSNSMGMEFAEELLVTLSESLLNSASCILKALSSMSKKSDEQ